MGKFLNFALGAAIGLAKIAGEKNRRAFELNERGVLIAERGNPDRALEYFYEAERLMPTNEELERAIKTNIKLCKKELNEYNERWDYHPINTNKQKSSRKSKKLENKFPIETERLDRSNSDWCDSCCTNIPIDSEYCPYCGSTNITKFKLPAYKIDIDFDTDKYNFCRKCKRPILKIYGACPHCSSKKIEKF